MTTKAPKLENLFQMNARPLSSAQLGAFVAMSSFAMLFGTFILGYFLARARVPVWPPIGAEAVPVGFSTLSTLIVIISSYLIHLGYLEFQKDMQKKGQALWFWGTFLGALFFVSQLLLWFKLKDLGFKVETSLWGSIVFSFIAIHAVHVLFAYPTLFWVLLKNSKWPTAKRIERIQIVGWFWHFFGALWLTLYLLLVWI